MLNKGITFHVKTTLKLL